MARFVLVPLALSILSGGAFAADSGPVAILQGLDKTTARVTKFEAPVGKPVSFGTLQITVRDCRKRPPEQEPESAAYLDIDAILQDKGEPKHIFSGWMFASSPALNSLEDPVYDVWLLDCRTIDTASPPTSPG
ncbi:MAG TPA: DUF2155 domain-containing protein [Aliidongia sp.]|uniref:DUF2155 domain-containing protein n=1 Tax=Aliidongia sp. TaxID=1914230 RepID=UPI002DDCA41C|nr:DUF2155 domain-containing protein [Aliidongia sp.]HEV2674409.1 DUF2155 domain-containing protein [Aliidongia sp.]